MTNHSHYKETLNMVPSVYDFCLMCTPYWLSRSSRFANAARRMIFLRTNDTMYECSKAFSDIEKQMSAEFDTTPANILEENNYLKFNGAIISCKDTTYSITQFSHVIKLTVVDFNNAKRLTTPPSELVSPTPQPSAVLTLFMRSASHLR